MSTLSSYLKNKLEAWVPVEGLDSFEVKLAYLSREDINKIRTAATRVSFNNRARVKQEELDQDLFIKEFIKATVLDWKGFTIKVAAQLLPIVAPEGVADTTTIDFTIEEAITLARESTFFDNWLNEAVFDLQTFRSRGAGE
jgi:hypothetical protein